MIFVRFEYCFDRFAFKIWLSSLLVIAILARFFFFLGRVKRSFSRCRWRSACSSVFFRLLLLLLLVFLFFPFRIPLNLCPFYRFVISTLFRRTWKVWITFLYKFRRQHIWRSFWKAQKHCRTFKFNRFDSTRSCCRSCKRSAPHTILFLTRDRTQLNSLRSKMQLHQKFTHVVQNKRFSWPFQSQWGQTVFVVIFDVQSKLRWNLKWEKEAFERNPSLKTVNHIAAPSKPTTNCMPNVQFGDERQKNTFRLSTKRITKTNSVNYVCKLPLFANVN